MPKASPPLESTSDRGGDRPFLVVVVCGAPFWDLAQAPSHSSNEFFKAASQPSLEGMGSLHQATPPPSLAESFPLSDRPPARHNTQDSPRKKAVVDSSEYSGVESFSLPPFAIKHTMGRRRRRRWVGMEWGDFGRPRKKEEKRDGQERRRRRRRHYVRREWRENDAHLLFCFSPSLLLLLRRIPPSDVKSCTLSLS